jgi:hypothetical protein
MRRQSLQTAQPEKFSDIISFAFNLVLEKEEGEGRKREERRRSGVNSRM